MLPSPCKPTAQHFTSLASLSKLFTRYVDVSYWEKCEKTPNCETFGVPKLNSVVMWSGMWMFVLLHRPASRGNNNISIISWSWTSSKSFVQRVSTRQCSFIKTYVAKAVLLLFTLLGVCGYFRTHFDDSAFIVTKTVATVKLAWKGE